MLRATSLLIALFCASIGSLDSLPALRRATPAPDAPFATAEEFTLEFGPEGIAFGEFVEKYASIADRKIVYSPRAFAARTFMGGGTFKFDRAEAESVFQRILLANDCLVTTMSARGNDILMIEDVKTSSYARQNARVIEAKDIANALARPAEIVTLTVPLVNIDCEQAQRALMNIICDARIGFVMPVVEANALVITQLPAAVHMMVSHLSALEDAAGTDANKARRAKREAAATKEQAK